MDKNIHSKISMIDTIGYTGGKRRKKCQIGLKNRNKQYMKKDQTY